MGEVELVHELLQVQKRKQSATKTQGEQNVTVKRVEVRDQTPISYPVRQCYQPLWDRMSYSQRPVSNVLK